MTVRLLQDEIALTENFKNRFYTMRQFFISLFLASFIPIATLTGFGQILSFFLLFYGLGMAIEYQNRIGRIDKMEISLRVVQNEMLLCPDCLRSEAEIVQIISRNATARRTFETKLARNSFDEGRASVGLEVKKSDRCPSCNANVQAEWKVCGFCGILFSEDIRTDTRL
jgi:hypothetical protein